MKNSQTAEQSALQVRTHLPLQIEGTHEKELSSYLDLSEIERESVKNSYLRCYGTSRTSYSTAPALEHHFKLGTTFCATFYDINGVKVLSEYSPTGDNDNIDAL
jgi:hypothetical protein